jgi:Flp pilus assembly protein TadD
MMARHAKSALLIGFLIVLLGIGSAVFAQQTATPTGAVTAHVTSTDIVTLRKGPSSTAKTAGTVAPNAEVMIIGASSGNRWYQIQLADGTIGWIRASLLTLDSDTSAPSSIGSTATPHPAITRATVQPTATLATPTLSASIQPSATAHSDSAALILRGNINFAVGGYQLALDAYTQAITLDPNSAEAYARRGDTYVDLKQYDKAIADYDHSITLDPNFIIAYDNLGATYLQLGNFFQALANFNKEIQLAPTKADAYISRGSAYYGLSDFHSAIKDFEHAIELAPDEAIGYYWRGFAYTELGSDNDDAARSDLCRYLSLAGKDALPEVQRELTKRGWECTPDGNGHVGSRS